MNEAARLAFEFFGGMFAVTAVMAGMGVDSYFLMMSVGFIGGIGSIVLFETCRGKKQQAAYDYMRYSKSSETLTVMKRTPENEKVLKVTEMADYNLNYHPSEYVYTGATVGGVHTGGVCDLGNFYTLDGTSMKKYRLIYKGLEVCGDEYCPIKTIKLDASLVESAKKNAVVNKFLKSDGTLVLTNGTNFGNSENVGLAAKYGNTDLAMKLMKADYFEQQLSKEQCVAIKNWLCGL